MVLDLVIDPCLPERFKGPWQAVGCYAHRDSFDLGVGQQPKLSPPGELFVSIDKAKVTLIDFSENRAQADEFVGR
jgi:hypothetical protein